MRVCSVRARAISSCLWRVPAKRSSSESAFAISRSWRAGHCAERDAMPLRKMSSGTMCVDEKGGGLVDSVGGPPGSGRVTLAAC